MKMFPISLPYYVDPGELPGSMPTQSQIENSEDLLMNQTGRKVVVIDEHFVVKYGAAIDLFEGRRYDVSP